MNIIRFDYQESEIRVIRDENGEPWWVAKDVCGILGLNNVAQAVSSLDEDEKGITNNDTLGGVQELITINEPGLYTLILKSRKPQAKAFKRWITHDVLPSIRKTGGYDLSGFRKPVGLQEIGKDLYYAKGIARLLGLKGTDAVLAAAKLVSKIAGMDCFELLEIERPEPEPEDPGLPGMISGSLMDEFINDCCDVAADAWVVSGDLYKVFSQWHILKRSSFIPSHKAFGHVLQRRFQKTKLGGYYRYHGLRLKKMAVAASS